MCNQMILTKLNVQPSDKCFPVIETKWNLELSEKNEIRKATQWESLIEMCKPVISTTEICATQWYNKIKCAN